MLAIPFQLFDSYTDEELRQFMSNLESYKFMKNNMDIIKKNFLNQYPVEMNSGRYEEYTQRIKKYNEKIKKIKINNFKKNKSIYNMVISRQFIEEQQEANYRIIMRNFRKALVVTKKNSFFLTWFLNEKPHNTIPKIIESIFDKADNYSVYFIMTIIALFYMIIMRVSRKKKKLIEYDLTDLIFLNLFNLNEENQRHFRFWDNFVKSFDNMVIQIHKNKKKINNISLKIEKKEDLLINKIIEDNDTNLNTTFDNKIIKEYNTRSRSLEILNKKMEILSRIYRKEFIHNISKKNKICNLQTKQQNKTNKLVEFIFSRYKKKLKKIENQIKKYKKIEIKNIMKLDKLLSLINFDSIYDTKNNILALIIYLDNKKIIKKNTYLEVSKMNYFHTSYFLLIKKEFKDRIKKLIQGIKLDEEEKTKEEIEKDKKNIVNKKIKIFNKVSKFEFNKYEIKYDNSEPDETLNDCNSDQKKISLSQKVEKTWKVYNKMKTIKEDKKMDYINHVFIKKNLNLSTEKERRKNTINNLITCKWNKIKIKNKI